MNCYSVMIMLLSTCLHLDESISPAQSLSLDHSCECSTASANRWFHGVFEDIV